MSVLQRRAIVLAAMFPSKARQPYEQITADNQLRVDRLVEVCMQEACAAVLATAESMTVVVRPTGDLMRGTAQLVTELHTVAELHVEDDQALRPRVLAWVREHWDVVQNGWASRVLAANTTDRGGLRLSVMTVAEETY